ncbi:hypothetical protein [Deinococcus aquaedulcis]|uniref:hypothetical protein n=1 Tax=Deinococcus aquaedulcis TaxID=2840455 RepID=UPI001C830616|nr:hypothetical protein [Deinococcus aquaedulcis]
MTSAASISTFRPVRRRSHSPLLRTAVTAQMVSDVPHAGLLLAPAAQQGLAVMDDGHLAVCLTMQMMKPAPSAEALEEQADRVTTFLHEVGDLSGRLVLATVNGQSQAYLLLHVNAGHLTPEGRVREAAGLRDLALQGLNGPHARFVASDAQACHLLASQYPKVELFDGALEDEAGNHWSTITMMGAPYTSSPGMFRSVLEVLAHHSLSYFVMDFKGRAKSSEARFGVAVVVATGQAESLQQQLEDNSIGTFRINTPAHVRGVMDRAAPFVQGKLERYGVLKQNVADFLTL